MSDNKNNGIIQAITEMLPDAPPSVLIFVYWYLKA